VGMDRLGMYIKETSAATDSCDGGQERRGVEVAGWERWASGGKILARHFPAVRLEQEGVFG
jgi:hypothetical protein